MTKRKHFKKRVRSRAAKTGESYTAARDQVIRQAKPAEEMDPEWLKETTGISNEAVARKTGKDWNRWIAVLDAAKAREMEHRQIAKYLHERHGVPNWWSQMITVGYERVRGLRQHRERADGFAASKSKTMHVPVSKLFQAWQDDNLRRRWLDEGLAIRKSNRDKSMRITWGGGRTSVHVYFQAKGESKSQVNVQHAKLADGKEAESLRSYWGDKLAELKKLLETE